MCKKAVKEFKESRTTIYRWNRKYNNIGMNPLNLESPNEKYEEYVKVTAKK